MHREDVPLVKATPPADKPPQSVLIVPNPISEQTIAPLSLAEMLRADIEQTIASVRERCSSLIKICPEQQREELKGALTRALAAYTSCFNLRVSQSERLQTGEWSLPPHDLLGAHIDLFNDQYGAMAKGAITEWNEFVTFSQSGVASTLKRVLAGAPPEKAAEVKVQAAQLQKKTGEDLSEAQTQLNNLLKRVKTSYNKVERELAERFSLDSGLSEVILFLNAHRHTKGSLLDMSRAFARGETYSKVELTSSDAPIVTSAGGTTGRSSSASLEAQTYIRRSLVLELHEKLSRQLEERLTSGNFTQEERSAAEEAFSQGLTSAQNFSLVPEPVREASLNWRLSFVRKLSAALNIISAQEKREAIAPIFSLQAIALGLIGK